ncbi:venom allergen 5-like [Lucilia cuprina]|uniref:venom allergen 5-like n=1 Tax=Lucilia cuprina TaxID=7375 RepID=UPI001F06C11D|nr:venom allergen 5-like [Lucilia cuprina]
MKTYKILMFLIIPISISSANEDDDDIFTDYCRPGLCEYNGGDGMHSGCRDGVLHNGKFQYPPCPDNAAIMPLSEKDKQDILEFHNNQRNFVACGGLYKKYGIKPGCRHGVIRWDKELEKTAFLHSSYCTFAHDKCRNTIKYPFAGQNLGILYFVGKPMNATAYGNVLSCLWYAEHRVTKMAMIDSFYHQTEVMVGHFLTSLNERNDRIGCTCIKFYYAAKKKEAVMLSCNYPTTNIAKSTVYNSCKVPASKCTTGTDPKYKFLCSSKEVYDVSGKLKYIPYDGDGTEVFNNCGRQPELLHLEREGKEAVKKHDKDFVPDPETSGVDTTSKPVVTTAKPGKPTSKPPSKPPSEQPSKPPEIDGGNPEAGGIPDYSEHEYDPPSSGSSVICQKGKLLMWFIIILFNFL